MDVVAALAALAVLVWLLLHKGGGAAEPGPGPVDDGTIDDMQLHDEVNPGDEGDVGDTSDGR